MNREIHEHFRSLCFRSVLLTAIFGVVFLSSSSFADAQSTGGRIRGTVTDASGAAVAGATVTLINMATNVTREATTSGNGEYLFLEVPVGRYEIDVNQTGFKKFVRRDIGVDLNQVVGVDITLQVGATSRNRGSDGPTAGDRHFVHATRRGGQ